MQLASSGVDTEVDAILITIRLLLTVSIGAIVGFAGWLIQLMEDGPSRGLGGDFLASITGAILADLVFFLLGDSGQFTVFDGVVVAALGGLIGLLAAEILTRDQA